MSTAIKLLNELDNEIFFTILYNYIFILSPDKIQPRILLSKLNINKIISFLERLLEKDINEYSAIKNFILFDIQSNLSDKDKEQIKIILVSPNNNENEISYL